jgi:ATP-dependent Clp protease ATP-binding subunit ClpB
VILFDEIEKAHPDVFNLLLQILDDGRLTDSQGRTVDFRNTVVIMTSNVGGQHILENAADDDWEDVEREVLNALREQFRPEFLNRVDDVIVFRPLAREDIDRILDLQLTRLRRLLAERKLALDLTFGARPLKRAIQRLLQNPLALAVLEGRFTEGDRIVVDMDRNGELTFERAVYPAGERAGGLAAVGG